LGSSVFRYHAYTDVFDKPAGDYLGSLSQMDDSLGVLRKVLQRYNLEENTMVWFTTDNGPHTLADAMSLVGALAWGFVCLRCECSALRALRTTFHVLLQLGRGCSA
jgi:arylsulfatase A-like enzyme